MCLGYLDQLQRSWLQRKRGRKEGKDTDSSRPSMATAKIPTRIPSSGTQLWPGNVSCRHRDKGRLHPKLSLIPWTAKIPSLRISPLQPHPAPLFPPCPAPFPGQSRIVITAPSPPDSHSVIDNPPALPVIAYP